MVDVFRFGQNFSTEKKRKTPFDDSLKLNTADENRP